jgi:starch phosphorylase
MFAQYRVDSITNGVHIGTWTCRAFQTLFDRYIPGWRGDNFSLRYALSIPAGEVQAAHEDAKDELIEFVNRETNGGMDTRVLTLGFARRAATYKRADLVLSDVERLRRISREVGPLQIVFAGKAHPRDEEGKEVIRRIHRARESLRGDVRIAYLPNYDWELGELLTSGVDLWLNTPQRPLEASGTSGMKAAINGVPSLSILDGWWIEGCIEGVTGWGVGQPVDSPESAETSSADDAAALYDKLENVILPLYQDHRDQFVDVMRHAIALNGAYFNTHRMLLQYVRKAYADMDTTADTVPDSQEKTAAPPE